MTILYRLLIVAISVPSVGIPAGDFVPLTKRDIPADLPTDLKLLIEQTFSGIISDRVAAAEKIGEMGSRAVAAVPFLVRLADDCDRSPSETGYYARKALVAIGEPAVDQCIAIAKEGTKSRCFAAHSCLGEFKNSPRAVDALLEFLATGDSVTRGQVAACLIGVTDPRAVEPLIRALGDSNFQVRYSAAECFYRLRDPRALEPLIAALSTWDTGVTLAALNALGHQGDRRAVPTLLAVLQKHPGNEAFAGAAAEALGRISDPSVFRVLLSVLNDRRKALWTRVRTALGLGWHRGSAGGSPTAESDDSQALSALVMVLQDDTERVELLAAAAEALGNRGNADAIKVLLPLPAAHCGDNLGLQAALGVARLSHGQIGSVAIVDAIHGYKAIGEEPIYKAERRTALQEIAEHGTNWRVRFAARHGSTWWIDIPLAIAVVLAFAWAAKLLLRHRSLRKERG